MSEPYKVILDTYEGPLDLLLHLVNELEIDLYDIPVARITDQYMRYIHSMQQIELNIASEYLVMAATLLEIKSAMLLPKKIVEQTDEYEEDPRDALMLRLVEYRRYKEVTRHLEEKELEENQLYTRTPQPIPTEKELVVFENRDVSIYDMLHAFDKLLERKSFHQPLETKINLIEISIEERMVEVLEILKVSNRPIPFERLFPYPTKHHIVTTFLVILQLLKNKQIDCNQDAQFQPIFIVLVGENDVT
jgi:segregation and condensation protein A